MTQILKLYFATDTGSTRIINVYNPKENLTSEEIKAAMEAIVNSQAFADILAPIKAVLCTSEKELMYEA